MAVAAHHAPAPASYQVKSGDTLSQLALDFYGRASRYPEIQAANPAVIKDPDLIYTGDTLKIPDAAFVPPPAHKPRHAAPYRPRHAKPTQVHAAVHAAQPHFRAIPVKSGSTADIARYFTVHGATKAAAAGVAACIWGESEGNPESVGSGGFGLIGWTGNNTGLPKGYFGPTGDKARDMDIQLAGVVGYIEANGGWGPINAAGGPVAAAKVFSSKYERPAVLYSDIHYGGPGDPTAIFNAI